MKSDTDAWTWYEIRIHRIGTKNTHPLSTCGGRKKKLSIDLHTLYNDCDCGHHEGQKVQLEFNLNDIFEKVAAKVFRDKKPFVDKSLWELNKNELLKGIDEGINVEDRERETVQKLHTNAAVFAAFKNHHNTQALVDALVDNDGNSRTFAEFKEIALTINTNYNQNWLYSEYQLAQRSAAMAVKWDEFQKDKDLFPNLKYQTVGDERVREDHQKIDGVVLPIDDNFWDYYYPPNGWGCRCTVVQTNEPVTPDSKIVAPEVPNALKSNPAKSGTLVNETAHPYFDVTAEKKKEIEALIKKLNK